MQVLNEHVAALCGSECLKAFFSLPDFKCNIIALLTDCILYIKGLGCSEEHGIEVARARYEEKKLDEHRSRADHTVQSPIVLSDEGDKDDDDTARLSELITLAEAGLQVGEGEDDTSRLSELIALAEAGLHAEEAEDDTGRLSDLIPLAEAGL